MVVPWYLDILEKISQQAVECYYSYSGSRENKDLPYTYSTSLSTLTNEQCSQGCQQKLFGYAGTEVCDMLTLSEIKLSLLF